MNERIKELEQQAEKFVMSIPASLDINEHTAVFNEKFAELIVQECVNVSLKSSHRYDDMGAIIANNIEEHFGVE